MGQAIPPRAILIVEDEVFIRHDLMDFFSDRGFIAFEAEDGDEAIKIIADHPEIGIVLTDIQMKGSMDGLRLARYVRDRYPPMLIAVVSGNVRPSQADLPEHSFFVAKPFDPRYVLSEIDRLSS
ncbi:MULTISPECIES: response regulator [Sphingomonas]|jgi:CheY-like chemotaxis protein|uniref:Response regulator n=2 Tax=Sphingomonas TaxID=13687 RepID=A0A7Y2KKY1_SPHPI|nr:MULTISPECIES: response regulator [Sphingomonas]MBM3926855.1 response regulator [Sphingomonadales bacterium]MCI1141164.1 response regulator [Sphingomonas sp. WKB10]ATI56815.1 response regulator [Sphingomonas melonis]MBX8846453.1 response regulator [Sphingomonas melonis]MBX8855597.1 response regulator [Sphingomonas melonis]